MALTVTQAGSIEIAHPFLQENGMISPGTNAGPSATLLAEAVVSPYCTLPVMSLHPPDIKVVRSSYFSVVLVLLANLLLRLPFRLIDLK